MARRKERPAGPLEPRSAAILRAIIEEYVSTAAPIGSQALVERRQLDVSSATVRNIMAELEAAGLLHHPHTSAGRVPTDMGYRIYVESIARTPMPLVDQLMIRHQFGQVEFASEQWFRLAASALAGATRAAGLATAAKPATSRVKRVELLPTGERHATVVLVLADGPIKQALIALDSAAPDEPGIERLGAGLNALLEGRSTAQVQRIAAGLPRDTSEERLVAIAAQRVADVMRDFDAAAVEDVFSEGLLNVMAEPEFDRSEKLRRVFSALQNRDYLGMLVTEVARSGDVQVFIGTENRAAEMQDVSLVVGPYGRPGRALGVVGVLGPTRMAYAQAISSVRYVSGLMNELVESLY